MMDTNSIYVALNIGSSEITAMAVRKNEDGQLRVLGIEQGASEGVRHGVIMNPFSASAVVSRLLKLLQNRIGSEIRQIYVGLNGRSLKTLRAINDRQLHNGTKVTDQLLDEMLNEVKHATTEQGTIYEVYAQETKVDGETEPSPTGCICDQIEAGYRVILGNPELRVNIERCVESAGYALIGTPVQIVTMADVLLSPIEKEQGCCLIDFGAQCTSLAVFYRGYMRYVSVIPLGGKNITKDIPSLGIPENSAEQLKMQFTDTLKNAGNSSHPVPLQSEITGIEPERIPLHTLAYIIEARANEILDLILLHIQKSGLSGHLGAGIIVTGQASGLRNLDRLIQQKTQLPVRTGTHSRYLEDGTDERYHDIKYSPLAGILLSADTDCRYKEVKNPAENIESDKRAKTHKKTGNSILHKVRDRLTDGLGVLFQDEE